MAEELEGDRSRRVISRRRLAQMEELERGNVSDDDGPEIIVSGRVELVPDGQIIADITAATGETLEMRLGDTLSDVDLKKLQS